MTTGDSEGNRNKIRLEKDTIHFHCKETSTSLERLREKILLASYVPNRTPARNMLATPTLLGIMPYAIPEENHG